MKLKLREFSLKSFFLNPLNIDDINLLLAETFSCPLEKAGDLAELIEKKTNGNPFFINEFIKTLYADNAIEFDIALMVYGHGTLI